MRRVLLAMALLGIVGGCSSADRYDLHFGRPITVARVSAVQAMAVDGDTLYYGVFDTGEVFKTGLRSRSIPVKVGAVDVRAAGADGLQSLAVYDHRVFVSYVRDDRHLVVGPIDGPLTWIGPLVNSKRRDGHIAFTPNGDLYVSVGHLVYALGRNITKVSDGWENAFAFTIDGHDRMFVADQPPLHGKTFVARGRENNHAKRRRFATGLAGTKASGIAFVNDELLVCRSNVGDVVRLHVGLDEVARRRGSVAGVKCRNAIVAGSDGSVITAIAHEIRRYPPA